MDVRVREERAEGKAGREHLSLPREVNGKSPRLGPSKEEAWGWVGATLHCAAELAETFPEGPGTTVCSSSGL